MKNRHLKIVLLAIVVFIFQTYTIASAEVVNVTRQNALKVIMESLRENMGLNNEQLVEKYGNSNNTKPFSDTTDEDVITARKLGIVSGATETTFHPNNPVTREEFAVMLMNQKPYIETRAATEPLDYEDSNKISSWAIDSVSYISSIMDKNGQRIMRGEDGNFDPKGYMSYIEAEYIAASLHNIIPLSPESKMILIEGGDFMMGSEESSDLEEGYGPLHKVILSNYYISNVEVTQKEFQSIMGFNPSIFKGEDFPVFQVTWYDAVSYCNNLSEKNGLNAYYIIENEIHNEVGNITYANVGINDEANGYRLPSEAQFIYASLGGIQQEGYIYAGGDILDEVAWSGENTGLTVETRGPRPVGTKKPNHLGLYDMTGNVSEWCNDWYNADYYTISPEKDPLGPNEGEEKVRLGGSWITYPEYCVVGFRGKFDPGKSLNNLGFRVVLPAA